MGKWEVHANLRDTSVEGGIILNCLKDVGVQVMVALIRIRLGLAFVNAVMILDAP
jgi:hypothetical protein